MTDSSESNVQLDGTDLLFDCPKCGNNLVVDARGAGLTVNCPDCGEPLLIPAPAAMSEPVDEHPENATDLQTALVESENHVKALRSLIKEIETRHDPLEREHAENIVRVKMIAENVKTILEAGERIAEIIEKPPTKIDLTAK